jgi:hypothetical protein
VSLVIFVAGPDKQDSHFVPVMIRFRHASARSLPGFSSRGSQSAGAAGPSCPCFAETSLHLHGVEPDCSGSWGVRQRGPYVREQGEAIPVRDWLSDAMAPSRTGMPGAGLLPSRYARKWKDRAFFPAIPSWQSKSYPQKCVAGCAARVEPTLVGRCPISSVPASCVGIIRAIGSTTKIGGGARRFIPSFLQSGVRLERLSLEIKRARRAKRMLGLLRQPASYLKADGGRRRKFPFWEIYPCFPFGEVP